MELKNWYRTLGNANKVLPQEFGHDFAKFAGTVNSIVDAITQSMSVGVEIDANTDAIAFYDRSRNMITLSAKLFSKENPFIDTSKMTAIDEAIAVVSFIAAHEAAHARYSLPMERMVESIKRRHKIPNQVAAALCNICEDIYVDALVARTQMVDFAGVVTEVFFNKEKVEELLGNDNKMYTLLAMKNAEVNPHDYFGEATSNAIDSLRLGDKHMTQGARMKMFIIIADELFAKQEFKDTESDAGDDAKEGDGPSTPSMGTEGDDTPSSTSEEEAVSGEEKASDDAPSANEASYGSEIDSSELSDKDQEELQEIAEAATEEISKANLDKTSVSVGGYRVPKIVVGEQKASPRLHKNELKKMKASIIDKYGDPRKFIRHLKQITSVNTLIGNFDTRGRKMVNSRLHRISTDGKIFGQEYKAGSRKGVEISFLIDASGSMIRHKDAGVYWFGSADLHQSSVVLASMMADALSEIQIPSSVWHHSGLEHTHSVPYVSLIQNNGINGKTRNNDERLIGALHFDKNQNYDGFAITEICKRFTHSTSQKILITLSDGVPYGNHYTDDASFDHTQDAIKHARKSGIEVICISLVDSVRDKNNVLYGRKNNIDGTKNLGKELRRVIENLVH